MVDALGQPLSTRCIRYPAFDARSEVAPPPNDAEVERVYTLADQLFVEPQPTFLPDEFDLAHPIEMSREEVAIARSHIGVWRTIAESESPYALVIEDDVWLQRDFGKQIDEAWNALLREGGPESLFDILYVSYKEVRHGAPKQFTSTNVFRVERGLWYLSGYILSSRCARALLERLPCRGPVDLWINHQFGDLDVRALRRPVMHQRLDIQSTNRHSVLPLLTKIGVLDYNDGSLFRQRPTEYPVFGFGASPAESSSLAMALSMLGYRCCSDLERLPDSEHARLMEGGNRNVFNAYINIRSLRLSVPALRAVYPRAKFVLVGKQENIEVPNDFGSHAVLRLQVGGDHTWQPLCEFLRMPPPAASYPAVSAPAPYYYRRMIEESSAAVAAKRLRYDRSPWVIEHNAKWSGVQGIVLETIDPSISRDKVRDDFRDRTLAGWFPRTDTFPGNLALFRPANIDHLGDGGLSLRIVKAPLGVRDFGAAAITSHTRYLYGRFEASLRAADISGSVTGFFLHRNSPRQEIDCEITGNDPRRLLVNVFYNPGAEGAKFDYGYRGSPASVPLWFDASKEVHRYAIEWGPNEIRWFVDDRMVHRRVAWNPTPIPHLPMTLNVNAWPSRSRELAGKLSLRSLPASVFLQSVAIDAYAEVKAPR